MSISFLTIIPVLLLGFYFYISYRFAPREHHKKEGKDRDDHHAIGQIGMLAALALFGVDYFTSFFYASGEMMHALHPYGMENYTYIAVAIVAFANLVFGFLYMFSLGPFNEGGGSYTAAMRYLIPTFSLVAAIALIEDYVLTIVVSALSGADQFLSVLNAYHSHWIWHFLIGALLAGITWYLTIRGRGESAQVVFISIGVFVFLTITMAVGLSHAYLTGVPSFPFENHLEKVNLTSALLHLLTASMKGMVALTGLEAMSNGIQFIKDEDAGIVVWGKKHLPKFKKLWEFYSGKSGIGRIVQTSFIFYGGITTTFLVFFSIHFHVFDGTLGRTLVGNLAYIGFNQLPGGNLLFWTYQFLAVVLLAFASMTAFQDAQATEWRDVAIGAIPETIVKRDRKGTFTRSVTFTFVIAMLIMLLVKGRTSVAIPFYSIGVFLPISIMGFAIRKHVLTHYTGLKKYLGAAGATFAGILASIIFFGQVFGKWGEGGWIRLITFTALFLLAHLVIISPGGLRSPEQIYRIVRDKARVQGSMASIVEWQSMKMQEYRYKVIRLLSSLMSIFNIRVLSDKLPPPIHVEDYDHSLHLDHPEAPSFLEKHIENEIAEDTQYTHKKVLEHYTRQQVRNSVIIPISDLDEGTLQAIEYARLLSNDITAVHVSYDTVSTQAISKKWDLLAHGTRLKILMPDFENFIAPLIEYVEKIDQQRQPKQKITILVPQIVETSFLKKLRPRTAMLLRVEFSNNQEITIMDIPYMKK